MARPFTKAEACDPEFRHIADFIPDQFKVGEHFAAAKFHAEQVARSQGQAKFHHTKNCVRHLLEGLK